MLRLVLWLTCLCVPLYIFPFNFSSISGQVVDNRRGDPLASVSVRLDGFELETVTDSNGSFLLDDIPPGDYDLLLSLNGYRAKRMPVTLGPNKRLKLGVLFMESELVQEDEVEVVNDVNGDISAIDAMMVDFTVLNALREPYERRVAFNFSQAFYRFRGYDSKYREVLINGMPVNEVANGRAPFSIWGGLNDVFRNREFVSGLGAVAQGAGSLGGSLLFRLDPALSRPGLRISSSASNRSYAGRFMATYNSGNLPGRLAYSFSASRRWAEQGYVQGTLYDALSFFAAARYRINEKDALVVNALYAPQRRGSRAALTREVAALGGHRYNPYWGYDGEKMRNSRLRRSRRPLFLLNYMHRSSKFDWQFGLLYLTGYTGSGRLGYFKAPNPDPVYYRYLPSFELNGGVVNYENARLVRENFMKDPQLNWAELYRINTTGSSDGRANYLVYDDMEAGRTFGISLHGRLKLSGIDELTLGAYGRSLKQDLYALARDLLGADYHRDIDPYSGTNNQVGGSEMIDEGDPFMYNYRLYDDRIRGFMRYSRRFRKGQAYITLEGAYMQTSREGMYTNERYPENSLGRGIPIRIFAPSIKTGGSYRISGRHILAVNGVFLNRLPDLNALFVNPRENHTVVVDPQPERIRGGEISYRMDLPDLRSRWALFYTQFANLNQVSYYYLDGGIGSAFVQELRSGVETRHLGGELSLEYDLSSNVKADLVVAYGDYRYTSNPDLTINFNTVNVDQVIDRSGSYNLGEALMDGLFMSNGPQSAIAAGVNYRSPQYWWIGAVASYLDRNFVSVSGVRRTESFFTNPDTGDPFESPDPDAVKALLVQERLQPLYYLDLTAGKSWLFNSIYVSLFLSVNNLFNAVYETGGYEQNRMANYQDLYNDALSGTPSFGNKYWYGTGRTFFVNLAINL